MIPKNSLIPKFSLIAAGGGRANADRAGPGSTGAGPVGAGVDQLFCASHVNVVDRVVFCRSSSTVCVGAPTSPMSGSQ